MEPLLCGMRQFILQVARGSLSTICPAANALRKTYAAHSAMIRFGERKPKQVLMRVLLQAL
jgi:hypothetical protein